MPTFKSPLAFAEYLERAAEEMGSAQHEGMGEAGRMVARKAKEYLGHPQGDDGEFPAWKPLSRATEEGFRHKFGFWIPGKVTDLKYPPDTPLLRDGGLGRSIKSDADAHTMHVGSDDPIALWQELGTPGAIYPIEPRSFIGRAMFEGYHKAVAIVVRRIMAPLVGAAESLRVESLISRGD